MASRKNLKKSVNYICDTLLGRCVVLAATKDAETAKAINEIAKRIIVLRIEFVARISHTEPGSVRKFYKQFYNQFNEAVISINDDPLKLA